MSRKWWSFRHCVTTGHAGGRETNPAELAACYLVTLEGSGACLGHFEAHIWPFLLLKKMPDAQGASLVLCVCVCVCFSIYITSWQIDRGKWKQWQILFSWAPKSLQMVPSAMKLKDATPWKKSRDIARQHITKQREHFTSKGL